jgi:hypothetical protein
MNVQVQPAVSAAGWRGTGAYQAGVYEALRESGRSVMSAARPVRTPVVASEAIINAVIPGGAIIRGSEPPRRDYASRASTPCAAEAHRFACGLGSTHRAKGAVE